MSHIQDQCLFTVLHGRCKGLSNKFSWTVPIPSFRTSSWNVENLSQAQPICAPSDLQCPQNIEALQEA